MPLPIAKHDKADLAHKAYEAKLETVGEGERAIIAVISTGALDRDKEILVPGGADLTSFRKNPVVLWAHDYRGPPIAKAASPGWIRYDKHLGAIKAKLVFAETEFADEIFKLYQGGFLKSFSVGFDAEQADILEPEEKDIEKHPEWAGARAVYRKWELLEFSAVPVPANNEALAVAVSKGVLTTKTANALGVQLDVEAEPVKEVEPEPEPLPLPPVRRSIVVPQPVIVRRAAWPKKIALTTVETVAKIVKREIDRLRGRV